jgi:hypothetical protein
MYAAPTACCSFAVNRPAYFAPHGDVFSSPHQSSLDGATDCPGVHSVLKKLWLAPSTVTVDRGALSPVTEYRVSS